MRHTREMLLAALAVLGLSGAGELHAQELKFTNQCARQLTNADRSLFAQAFALVDKYKYEVEEHINASIFAGNPDSYVVISANNIGQWRGGVAEMARGDVKVACEYNATNNKCRSGAGQFGWTFAADPLFVWTRDRVHICIDNIRTSSAAGSAVALLAGALAHELMHHVDGFEGHGPGGVTNPANPDTAAETIGVAMEHLILTPDLQATIKLISSSFANSDHDLVIDVEVENLNAQANIGLVPVSGRRRNISSRLQLQVDGESLDSRVVAPLNGLGKTVQTFRTSIPAYDASADADYALLATIDSNAVIVEEDEVNNTDSATYSTEVDLSLSVEVSGPPLCHSMEFRGDAYPPGYYNWIEVPYRVAVKNRDKDTYAATTDVVMMYEDMWTDSAMTSQQEFWLSTLAPSETKEVEFNLDVPTDAACAAPDGATDVWFIADWNATSVFDSDRGNNVVYFDVDATYWRPDYVIASVALGSAAANRTFDQGVVDATLPGSSAVSYTVRNIGPTSASAPPFISISRTQVLDPDGLSVFSAMMGDLGPGEEVTYETTIRVSGCDPVTYAIEADYADTIDEFDEGNNDTNVRLYPGLATAIACGEVVPREPELSCVAVCAPGTPCSMPFIPSGAARNPRPTSASTPTSRLVCLMPVPMPSLGEPSSVARPG